MSILIRDIGELPNKNCEETDEKRTLLNNFREKVMAGKMVDFYTDIGTLTSAVGAALHRCVRDFPAKGWIRGESLGGADDIEAKIEAYLQTHTATSSDIEKLFENNTIVLNGGNASSNSSNEKNASDSNTISLTGARTLVEELAKKLPKVEWEEM